MTAERWARLEPMIDVALELAPEQRRAYIDEVRSTDAVLGAELDQLVAIAERPDSLLGAAAAERSMLLAEADHGLVADLRAQLQTALGASYVIDREIGGGGMSRVFVARERELGRTVVIKVLPAQRGAGVSAERFAQEIRLAASLQQANIVPVLAAGIAGEIPYYTMPFVEGQSLRDRIARDGPLPIKDALSILRDIARALAYAHARGVVHRDIKPGNVLLSGGTAVVTDFGIAKALGDARLQRAHTRLTQTGAGIGTPAYMAPEQAAGDPATDHRADMYAFGCLAYDILTGRPPFSGLAPHQVIAAHFRDVAPPVTDRRADAPPSVAELIAKCLDKDPDRRPQSAEEILVALESSTSHTTAATRAPARRRAWTGWALTIGAFVTAAVVLFARSSNRLSKRTESEPLALSAVPCLNVAGDTALDYLSDGLSDEMLNLLGRHSRLRIPGRQSAYRYKGRPDFDLTSVERQLGVRFLITCSLRQGAGRLTISVQLNDSLTQGELWSGTFTAARNDVGPVASQIAETIGDTLRVRFSGGLHATRRAAATVTTDPQAFDAYLVGQEQLKRRAIEAGVASFQRAIELDSTFARARAALAMNLGYYPYYLGTPPAELRDRIVTEARRALASDSSLADAHTALGGEYANRGEWDSADAEFRRAVALEPNNFNAHFTRARILVVQCRANEGLRELSEAGKIERVSELVAAWRALAFAEAGERDSAEFEISKALRLAPSQWAVLSLAEMVYLELGNADELRRVLAEPEPPRVMTIRPYLLARFGDAAAAERRVRASEALTPRPWYADVTHAYLALATGDTAAALGALENSARRSGPMWVFPLLPCLSAFDPIRRSARFAALLRRANLNVDAVTSGGSDRRR